MIEIFVNKNIYIIQHESSIPWLKIFTQKEYKELTECDEIARKQVYQAIETIEKAMLQFYKPKSINIAMFGNYMPHFHVHVMARFENDEYFPEPMWGEKQRNNDLILPPFLKFVEFLKPKLDEAICI